MAGKGVQETSGIGGQDGDFVSIHGRQIKNEAGATVSQISDLDYIKRFLILGRPELRYEPVRTGLRPVDLTKIRGYVECTIKEGKGMRIVALIKEISTEFRNISQDPVLYCLALCARTDDDSTKKEAYRILNEVCRIPTHLFQFIEYYTVFTRQRHERDDIASVQKKEKKCKEKHESKRKKLKEQNKARKAQLTAKKENDHAAYGWGRAFKRAICKWFLSSDPEYLAYHLTKYRRRCGWSVKTVIQLAHVKSEDIIVTGKGKDKQIAIRANSTDKQRAVGFILRYIRSNLKKAREFYKNSLEENTVVRRVSDMLADYDELRSSTDDEKIKNKITSDVQRLRSNPDNRKPPIFTIEHLSPKVLSCNRAGNVNIWRSLIPCIPGHALIRHAGFLTKLGVLTAEEDSSELMAETLKSFRLNLEEFIRPATAALPTDRSYTTQRPVHPCTIHLAMLQYKEGHTVHPGRSWTPVQKVTDILQDALKDSYDCTPGVQSHKMCIAIDVSGSMKTNVNGTKRGIECRTAAASLAFALAKTGSSIDIVMFSKKGYEVLSSDTDFNNFLLKIKETSLSESQDSDSTEPLKWAIEQKKTDIEAFVVFTVNENAKGLNEPVEGLQRYRNDFGKANTKMIVCTMNATRYTGKDRADQYMLDICGCDANLPLLIQEFVDRERSCEATNIRPTA